MINRITNSILCHSILFAEARPAKLFRMYIARSFAHFLMRRPAPEGRGPPSYFPRICISRLIAHVLMRRLATVEATALPAIYSPSETTALFPLFGKSILNISKNSSACADTHIGFEENYIWDNLKRLKCSFGLPETLIFIHIQGGFLVCSWEENATHPHVHIINAWWT